MADAAVAEKGKDQKDRPATSFRVFVRPAGGDEWKALDKPVTGRTQDEAKKIAARELGADGSEYAANIQGDGLEIAVCAARSFKPVLVKVEPQPAKVVIRG